MSLATPLKLRRFQEALYTKAKQEPAYRFYLLHDKVYRADILAHAYALAKQNGGAPGVDGVTFEDIEAAGVGLWLAAVQEALRTGTYRAQPVRRVLIPKPGGGERPLGIPGIRDRVVQTAAVLILQPIFEADLEPTAYGYRPGRSALEAVQEVHRALCAGHTEVIEADVSKYLDTVPHCDLMTSLARRISDRKMLRLLKMWLKAPVAERTESGGWRFSGGKRAVRGTPQGGVVSPLLANVYMNRYLKVFRLRGLDRRYGARLVNYADDFVVLCRYGAAEVLAQSRRWFTQTLLPRSPRGRARRAAARAPPRPSAPTWSPCTPSRSRPKTSGKRARSTWAIRCGAPSSWTGSWRRSASRPGRSGSRSS